MGEHLERYAAEVEAKESAAEDAKLFRQLCRVVIVGPAAGLVGGLALQYYAARLGVTSPPTLTGLTLLDGPVVGTLISGAIIGVLGFLIWVGRHDGY